jgi:ACS family hexuronate transporter-like MFS transporter
MANPARPVADAGHPPKEFAALPGRWTICAMLFVATTINYMDRQVLSILKPFLAGATIHIEPFFRGWPNVQRSISMNDVQYGNVVWCFQIAYAIGVIFAGRLVDRLGCRRGYPLVTAVWSLSAMGHALVKSVVGFGVARFFLGLGESGNFPAAIKATAEWFAPKERALATGVFNSGAGVGAILAPFIIPKVVLHFGWRAAFLVTGTFSALWIVWWSIRYRTPQVSSDPERELDKDVPAGPVIPWWHFLRYRQTWGFALGKFLTDPVWWFYLFWLPDFFNKSFKLDLTHIGLPLVVIYVCSTVGSVFGGWLPKGFVRIGLPLKRARLATMLVCGCLVVPIMFAGGLHSMWTAVALLSVATSAHQGWSANIFTTASDMFPAEHVGTVVSFGQVGGALGGAIFAQIAGHILQFTGSYVPLFVFCGFAYLIAWGVLNLLAPGLKQATLPVI